MYRKLIKVLSVVLVVDVLFIMSGCGKNNMNVINNYFYDDSDKYTLGGTELEISDIKNLDVSWLVDKVEIKHVTDNTVTKIKFYEDVDNDASDDLKMRYYLNGNTLKIKAVAPCTSFTHQFKIKKLYIELPVECSFEDFEIDVVSSDVRVTNITCQEFEIDSISGELDINNITCDDFKIDAVSSGIEASNIQSNKIDINTISGLIRIEDILSKEIDIDSTSADMILYINSQPESIDIDTISGKTKLYLPENCAFKAKLSSVSGDFSSDIPTTSNNGYFICGENGTDIEVSSTSGDLIIYKK